MKFNLLICFAILSFHLFGQDDPFDPFQVVLDYENPKLKKVLENPEKFELQICYTEINRNADNQPIFNTYTFHVDKDQYFYPASTVKMPTAFVALEKLNKLKIEGLDKQATMKTKKHLDPQTNAFSDSTAEHGLPTMAHYIKKLFVVSDNDAYNRLYEFCGQAYLNENLHSKGFTDLYLIHRLSMPGYNRIDNQHTNPVLFYNEDGPLYYQGPVHSIHPYLADQKELKRLTKGVGFYGKEGVLVDRPMHFGLKNYASLESLTDILTTVLFPDSVPEENRFDFSESDYQFLYRCMSLLPEESDFPDYKDGAHPDGYVKFFMYGDTDIEIPNSIRIFNKVGYAYGYLTDVAYIVDFEKGVEFMLSATLHVNENQIYNDGVYEYEEIGLPFLGELGRLFYQYECQREKNYKPDLSRFIIQDYH